jgi:hypothetical protein
MRPAEQTTTSGTLPRTGPGHAGSAWSRCRAGLSGPGGLAGLAGLGLGLLAVGPGLGPGFLLSYDMVFVPRMPFSSALLGAAGGPPRAVPSDAVVAVASLAIPGEVLQKIILVLIFVLACSGAARLLPEGAPLTARLAAGVCYAWNPYVAERMLIGQWALLLGYAGLPWVVRVVCADAARVRPARLLSVLVPAAIGGFAAMAVTTIAAVPAALICGGGRSRRLVTVLAAIMLLSLFWVIPALVQGVTTDPRGVDAFAARADTPFGRLGSLLMLSGIWNSQTVPAGYGGWPSAIWLLVVVASLCGLLLARPRQLPASLAVAGLAGLLIAAIGIVSPGRAALRSLVAAWPGFAVLRDGQQFLAPLALAVAVGLGCLVTWLWTAPERGDSSAGRGAVPATMALAVMAMLAPVVLLPGMAWGFAGRRQPVQYPADWSRAQQVIDGDPGAGNVLLLPWATYRQYSWDRSQTVFDPWSRLLGREVIFNDGLQVGRLSLDQESSESILMNRIVTRPGPLTFPLRSAGVRYVIIDEGPLLGRGPNLPARARLPGARVVVASQDLVVFRLPGAGAGTAGGAKPALPAVLGSKLRLG